MKSVLISIRPQWCEMIAYGKKTLEVRKTKPNLKPPFRVYIYCTKSNTNDFFTVAPFGNDIIHLRGNGRIIGEFICDYVERYVFVRSATENKDKYCRVTSDFFCWEVDYEKACLNESSFAAYGDGKILYGWHISNLIIYDEPRELKAKAPQSWRYVKEGEIL